MFYIPGVAEWHAQYLTRKTRWGDEREGRQRNNDEKNKEKWEKKQLI